MVGHEVNTIYCERDKDLTRLNEGSRSNKSFILAWPLLPTHCRCRVLLLHLITLSNTHTVGRAPLDDRSDRSRVPVPVQHTTFRREKHPCPRREKRNVTDINRERNVFGIEKGLETTANMLWIAVCQVHDIDRKVALNTTDSPCLITIHVQNYS